VLSRFARSFRFALIPWTGIRFGLAAIVLLWGMHGVHDATASGDTRTLSFHHSHSGEDLTITFKHNGRYDEDALNQLNYFLRDWRSQEQTTMDRHLFDIIWEVYRDVDARQPIQIVSAYRSPTTNAMLRNRSAHSGVARFSQHMLGHAMDFFIPNVPLEQIRFAGLRLQRGGVGFYPTSGSPFVHLDTGSIRHWPRMTHDELARVFPDGRTVHVPADGTPLPGYELALAEIQHRRPDDNAGPRTSMSGLLASIFRGGKQAEDDDETGPAEPRASSVRSTSVALTASVDAKPVETIPLPRAKPATTTTYQVASATPQPAAGGFASKQPTTTPRPQTPADIINARGFWGDETATPKQATPAQMAALAARSAFASADPQTTASVPETPQALAYAPSADRSRIVVASTVVPRTVRTSPQTREASPTAEISTIAKGQQVRPPAIATAARVTVASNDYNPWMRAMIIAPSASTDMRATSLGERDMTVMRQLFIKPNTAVAMTFSDDPQLGLTCDHFSGAAVSALSTMRTAALR
jgi:uncharacterized protein YcbK (DUF882 family)